MNWVLLLFFLAVVSYFGDNKKTNKSVAFVCRLILILVSSYITAFYSTASADHDNYVFRYNSINGSSLSEIFSAPIFGKFAEDTELGYYALNVICNFLGLGELGFFLVIALIVNSITVWFIYKHPLPWLSFLFIFSMTFPFLVSNLVRQSLAMAIFLLFFDCLTKSRWKSYIVGVLLAMLFHTSAFILFIFLPVCFANGTNGGDKKVSFNIIKYSYIVIWILSLMVGIGLLRFDILNYVGMLDTYQHYTSNISENLGSNTSVSRVIFFNLVALAAIFYTYKKNVPLAAVAIFTSAVLNMSLQYGALTRLYFYFNVAAYVYVSFLVSNSTYPEVKHKAIVDVARALVVGYCIYRLVMVAVSGL